MPAWGVLAIGMLGLLVYAFPGYMSNDSFLQLMEARSGIRSDAHPPIMAFEWSVLDAILSGPLLMLLLQGGFALFGLYRIIGSVLAPRAAAITAVAILWFPPVLTTFAVIWKDSQMAGYLLAGIACLTAERRRVRLVGLAALTVACAMRFNAAAAVMPAVCLLFVWSPEQRWWRRYAIALGASIAVVVVAFATTRLLTVQHIPQSPAMYDIIGVLAHCEPIDDATLREELRGTHLVRETGIQAKAKQLFTPRNPFWYDLGPDRMFDRPTDDAGRAAFVRAWKEIVPTHLAAYLAYRTDVFRELIGDTDDALWSPVWNGFYENDAQPLVMEHAASASPLQLKLARLFEIIAYATPLFTPYVYLWIGILVLALFARDRLSIAVLASGLLYELAYFPVAATPDYRYSHWLVVSVVCASVLVFVRRMRRR